MAMNLIIKPNVITVSKNFWK